MKILKDNAKLLTNDYINFGSYTNFRFEGSPIKGFFFNRKELNDLFKDNNQKELFMMLALSSDGANPPNKYLNVVVGSVLNNIIDTANLIISDEEPYTGTISYLGDALVKLSGDPISPEQLLNMQNLFTTTGSNDCLTSISGVKVKGYTLDIDDLTDLRLREPVNEANQSDLFIFMPVIRPHNAPPYDRSYVSLAVARFNKLTMKVSGTIIEYCLPCPNACPSNYPIQ